MSPSDRADALFVELRTAVLDDLRTAREQVHSALAEQAQHGDAVPLPVVVFLAVCVDRSYSAVEAALLRIAREIDDVTPQGEGWHAALVHQLTLPIDGRRPAVLSAECAAALAPLRKHRHWLRHAYGATFSIARLAPTLSNLEPTIAAASSEIERFVLSLPTR